MAEHQTGTSFLSDVELRPLQFDDGRSLNPIGLALGKGSQAVEVAIAEADSRPTKATLRRVWKDRHGGRAVPLVLVVLHNSTVSVCGPTGEEPPVFRQLEPKQAERICESALEAPDRHAALDFLRDVLPEAETAVPGLKNSGLLATHELEAGVPRRSDWQEANRQAQPLLSENGREALQEMGYEVESLSGRASVLKAEGSRRAVAVFLDQDEAIELSSERFTGLSPVSYALAQADQHNLPWVVVAKGRMLRLYSADAGTGVASRGRTDTYVQARTDLLRDDQAGYLSLLFSPDALAEGGTLEEILESSRKYAADLGGRLRERIYDDVVPQLAEAIARDRDLKNPTREGLSETYEITLLLLYRLLFLAYAEDRGLLPYDTNDRYRDRSLKKKARELTRLVEEGAEFDTSATHWREIHSLFTAVRDGNTEWEVPEYNGTLFSRDPDVSRPGAELEKIELSNQEFGPPLAKLLVDKGPEGLGPIDFRSLGVREFGTIYEGLLESELSVADTALTLDEEGQYVPAEEEDEVGVEAGDIYLHDTSGKRKSTGTFYTKEFAVEHLLEHSLDPALSRHLDELDELDETDASERFFDFRVADIAMGSGHFLLAAVDHIAEELSSYLAERTLPGVQAELERLRNRAAEALGNPERAEEIEDAQLLRRQIARRCLYGVDLNPTAVHLARLSLWIHTFVPGLPLSFLDHGLVRGNSILGIATLEEARDAANLVEEGQASFWDEPMRDLLEQGREAIERLGRLSDADASEIEEARRAQREAEESEAPLEALFDILTAARVDEELRERLSQGAVLEWDLEKLPGSDPHQRARSVLDPLTPFHFPTRFPEVFRRDRSGFDVIVGNPPWWEATLEKDEFWMRYHPGLQALPQRKQEEIKERYRKERPDLVAKYVEEREAAELTRRILTSGAFRGMSTGDPDLYKAFAWRFLDLAREDEGWVGVVLPRSAFCAKGSKDFRKTLLGNDAIHDLTLLVNNRRWVFDTVHPQYTIGLLSVRRDVPAEKRELNLRGPFQSKDRFEYGTEQPPTTFVAEDVEGWNDTAALPLLPAADSADLFAQIREAPRLDLDDGDSWRARPYREFDATNDKHLMDLESDECPEGYWPVFKGGSFGFWEPDTGTYYGWADPESAIERLQEKREWGARRSNSPWYEFPDEVTQDASTLPCHRCRLAFRDVARATDRRTVQPALLPPEIFLTNKAPFFLWPRGDEKDQAYLLGVMASIPYDWYMRRFVETTLNYHILNPSPIPRPSRSNPLWHRIVEIAGELATPDDRFKVWAGAVGADVGTVPHERKAKLIIELDAVTSHLYGLSASGLRHLFHTFHDPPGEPSKPFFPSDSHLREVFESVSPNWTPTERMERTLAQFEEWEDRL